MECNMEETYHEEFFEASNISENEYYDANSYDDTNNNYSFCFDRVKYFNTFESCFSNETGKSFMFSDKPTSNLIFTSDDLSASPAKSENGISRLTDSTKLNLLYDNIEDKAIRRDNEETNDEMEESAGILEAILNEESLKKIYFEDKCICNNNESLSADSAAENKINLWSYINNKPPNPFEKSSKHMSQYSREDEKLSSIEKEVEELELEIEKMFQCRSIQKLEVNPTFSCVRYTTKEDTNESYNCVNHDEKDISSLPACIDNFENCLSTHKISTIAKTECASNYTESESKKLLNESITSTSYPSITSRLTLDQALSSGMNQFETKSSMESEEIVTLMKTDISKALPVQSVEIIPKLLEKQRNYFRKKNQVVRNPQKTKTFLENHNFQTESKKSRKKSPRAKIPEEFKKVRSLIVTAEGTNKVRNNSSKSFHLERLNYHKILDADPSKSQINTKTTGKSQILEKKLKIPKDFKKIKYDNRESFEPNKNNRAVNTRRVTKKNFSCQKMGQFIDSKNFCSISLTLESVHHTHFEKETLLQSLKDYFWLTKSSNEKALLQLVILCVENNFNEISIKNEKFGLFCQSDSTYSFSKDDVDSEEAEDNENTFKSNLICQPVYIETISSRSQVNRLRLDYSN